MAGNRRLLDDVAKVAMSAAGIVQGAGREAEMLLRQRLERILDRMDLVPRDEFDVVKEMSQKTRLENELLAERITCLEKVIHARNATKPSKSAKKVKKNSSSKLTLKKRPPQKTSK